MSQQTEALLVPDMELETPDNDFLRRLLDALKVTTCRFATAYEGTGEWNNRDDAPGDSRQELTKDEFLRFVDANPGGFIHTELDGALKALATSLRQRYPEAVGKWFPIIGKLALGLHSYPDIEFEETIWRGHVSLGIYGDGIPDLEALRDVLNQDTEWHLLTSQVSHALRVPMRVELVAYY